MKERLIKIMIIIAIVIILLALGWMCYDKYIKKTDTDPDIKVVDETKKDNSDVTGKIADGEVLPTNSTVQELSKVFSTYEEEYTNYFKYSEIKKLSNGLNSSDKLFFTLYAMGINKESKSIKCSDLKVKESGNYKCGVITKNETTAYDKDKVIEKYKYLFGSKETFDLKEATFDNQKMLLDESNNAWILLAVSNSAKSGDYAKTKIDGAYSYENVLTINTIETINNEEKSVTLEFVFDEEVNHYVFSKRTVE